MRTCAALLGSYWHRIKTMSRRQKYTSLFLLLAVVIGVFLIPDVTSAQIEKDSIAGSIIIALTKFFLWLASLAMQLAIFFLKFFILIAGYNGYINADVVKFGWNIVRDVANMFFIVILLVIAFGTILGLEQYEWKKSLPKLVFAAVFVNFSNVICQLIIDVAQVFTITFLNAVAGTAGGNLINLMKFDQVFSIIKSAPTAAGTEIEGDLLIGALMALFLTLIAATTIGSYMIVMLYRMVTLWCLIILSPLAFLFSVLPSTQSYADEFWKEFANHVIAAPVMVFFLWLSFATFGGDIVTSNIQEHNMLQGYVLDSGSNAVAEQTSVSISEATSWINLANFAVAIGFMFIGLERVQKLGVRGGDYLQRGLDFGKKVFTIAAGYTLGRAMYDKAGGATGIAKSAIVGTGSVLGVNHQLAKMQERAKQLWIKAGPGKVALRREGDLHTIKAQTEAIAGRYVTEGERKSRHGKGLAKDTILLNEEKKREQGHHKTVEAQVRMDLFAKEKKKYDNEVERLKKEEIEAARKKGTPPPLFDDKKMAQLQEQAIHNLDSPILNALFEQATARNTAGKMEKEIDKEMGSQVADITRLAIGKIPKEFKNFLKAEAKDDIDDFGDLSYKQRELQFVKHLEDIDRLKTDIADPSKAKDKEANEKELAATVGRAMTLYAMAAENGDTNGYNDKVDASWAGVNLQDGNERHKVMLSLFTRKTKTELDAPNGAIEAENQLRDMLGNKFAIKMSGLGAALNREAERKGGFQNFNQINEGLDENGRVQLGFSNNMVAGPTGVAPAGAPNLRRLSTGTTADGATEREIFKQFLMTGVNVRSISDGRNLMQMKQDGTSMGALNDEAETVLLSIGRMNAEAIRSMNASIKNLLAGGKFNTSTVKDSSGRVVQGFDAASDTFNAGDMTDTFQNVLTQLVTRCKTGTGTTQEQAQKAIVELVQGLTRDKTHNSWDTVKHLKLKDSTGTVIELDTLHP